MRVLQADPGANGWWVLVEDDQGEQRLLNVPDREGRKALKPTEGRLRAQLVGMARTAPLPVADDDDDLQRRVDRLLSGPVDGERRTRLASLGRRLAALERV